MHQRLDELIQDYNASSLKITFSDQLLKWDSADFLLRYLGKTIDTTTQANELINASPNEKLKIISLFNGFTKEDVEFFKEQIKDQTRDVRPIKEKTEIKGQFRGNNRAIKFSQPIISSDNKVMIIKEYVSDEDCWGTTVSVYRRDGSKWKKDFELNRYKICT
jgi:hypothetical protein